jgi:hypothetical protein
MCPSLSLALFERATAAAASHSRCGELHLESLGGAERFLLGWRVGDHNSASEREIKRGVVVRQNFSRGPRRGDSWWSRREYDYRLGTLEDSVESDPTRARRYIY